MRRAYPVALAVALLLALVAAALLAPLEVDRRPNYEHDATVALGGAAIFQLLPELLGGAEVRVNYRTPYTHVRDTTRRGENYFFLTTRFAADSLLAHALLAYASRGNTVFVAAQHLDGPFASALGASTVLTGALPFQDPAARDSVLYLTAPNLARPDGFAMGDRVAASRFASLDSARATVLGHLDEDRVTYARLAVGEGQVLLSLTPRAFANYALVRSDAAAEYVAAALAYLPAQSTIWDATFKPQRSVEGSPLRFVLETPPLAWAYYTALLAALLFVLFRGRRWQRAIPVVERPPNRAAAFATGIARLWHEQGDDRALVDRRARFLIERLRGALHDPDIDLAPDHRERIARQLELPAGDIDDLFNLIARLRSARRVPPRDLLDLDRRLDTLYERL
jgi:hypothetical protein